MDRVVLVNEFDYAILTRPIWRRLLPPRYFRNLVTGRPIKEFAALARKLARGGFQVHLETQPPFLDGGPELEAIKIGPSSVDEDLRLMLRYGERNRSEWNRRNLETVQDFNHYIDLGRRTWNVNLRHEHGRGQLRALLAEHGRLFVKSVVKGHAELVGDYDAYIRTFGDLETVHPDSLDLLVSEVMAIREVRALIDGRRVRHTDEWRHHVYRQRRVATSHAFECDPRRTSDEHRAANVEYAEGIITHLRDTDFATTYVLDTCTLADGGCTVVEANFFFPAGIYDDEALDAIAQAIVEGKPGSTGSAEG